VASGLKADRMYLILLNYDVKSDDTVDNVVDSSQCLSFTMQVRIASSEEVICTKKTQEEL